MLLSFFYLLGFKELVAPNPKGPKALVVCSQGLAEPWVASIATGSREPTEERLILNAEW